MSQIQINHNSPIIQNLAQANKILKFTSTDSEEQFKINRERLGEEWYYYNKEIEYKYNSWGYRCKEFTDLTDDYILTFGCSFTEGIALHYDDMWANKLGVKMNMDVFNLGMGATGPDFQYYNTILFQNFILKNKKLPKLVVYQWPFKHRTSYMFKEFKNGIDVLCLELFSATYPENLYPHSSQYYFDWYKTGFIENGGELVKQTNLYPILCDNVWKSFNIPVVHWTWEHDFQMDYSHIFQNNVKILSIRDEHVLLTGRDCSHNGHKSQDIVVDNILKKIDYGFSK